MTARVDGAEPDATTSTAPRADGSSAADPERWCYAGEQPEATVPLGDGWAAVTSHRLLLFDPDPADGSPRFRQFDRPNVLDVRVSSGGTAAYLERLPQLVVYALVCFGGWIGLSTVDVSGLLSTEIPEGAGVGGLSSLLSAFRLGFEVLSVGLLVGGVACAAAALGLGGLYLRSRRRRLVVDRAGEDPVEHPVSGGVDAERLRATLRDRGGDSPTEGPNADLAAAVGAGSVVDGNGPTDGNGPADGNGPTGDGFDWAADPDRSDGR